ncbi:toxin Doc [Streptomyces sp. 11x1]|uniref:toxin Doc n=1 Tax=Streptomyces sp. 11x1 TaxID=3038642 RepID=UPI0029300CC8|nr:toxin Doc [Streptomyces sp. 11x1]WNZ14949.1 toxin Doc [Streptomyces sp. 11x1]
MPGEYYVDYRWFLERQAELLDDLAVNDYSVFVGLAARHKVDPPRHDQHHPDAFWRAAVMLEECVVLRPLPTRNELYGFGLAVAYLGMHGVRVNTKFEAWRELIADITALRLDSFTIAERLRSLRIPD